MALEPSEASVERANERLAMYVSLALAVLAVASLGLGVAAVPISGANCRADCISYPYLNTVDRFPRDYVWMYVAMAMVVSYLLFMVSLRVVAAPAGSLLGQMSVAVAVVVTVVLVATYFTQSSVVPASLRAGETEGVTLLTMYNPHGLFIALEEIGYLLMSLSFLLAALMIGGVGKMVRAIRRVFGLGFVLPLLALIGYVLAYGLDRQDRFEVVIISVDWLVLIVNGILVALVLRKRLSVAGHSPIAGV
jgi:hypothetical protein